MFINSEDKTLVAVLSSSTSPAPHELENQNSNSPLKGNTMVSGFNGSGAKNSNNKIKRPGNSV